MNINPWDSPKTPAEESYSNAFSAQEQAKSLPTIEALDQQSQFHKDVSGSLMTSSNNIQTRKVLDDLQFKQPINPKSIQYSHRSLSKSQKIGSLQTVFTESQKVAYVGLCYLIGVEHKVGKLIQLKSKKALSSYEKWLDKCMEKLFVYLDFSDEEKRMIRRLAEHGLSPSDMASTLVNDAQAAADHLIKSQNSKRSSSVPNLDSNASHYDTLEQENQLIELTDVRYTIIAHFFVLSIVDGVYDSRARTLLKCIAEHLQIPWTDVIQLEKTIAEQLIALNDPEEMRKDGTVVDSRNTEDSKGRWALAAAATLAGGAVIGLTAGIAAPLIGAGIGSVLGWVGLSGAAGIGTFMGSTAGLALITTSGVVTGGGIFGNKMIKRTRGIEEFEFIPAELAMSKIEENKEARREARRSRLRREAHDKRKLEEKINQDHEAGITPADIDTSTIQLSIASDECSDYDGIKSRSSSRKSLQESVGTSRDTLSVSSVEMITADSDNELSNSQEPIEITRSVVQDPAELASSSSKAQDDDGDIKFKEEPLKPKQTNVLLMLTGWLAYGEDDYLLPFSTLEPNIYGDSYVLHWESEILKNMGSALILLVAEVTSFVVQQSLQVALTALSSLLAGLSGPLWALKLTYLLDNPWGNGLTKAKRAGRVLADNLMAQVQENRPVTLIGFSLGARVIYYCLEELGKRNAYGIVEEAYLLGTPVMARNSEWHAITSVVSGRLVNGYLNNDWVLGFLYRASSGSWSDVPGLNPVQNVPGIENVILDDVIDGHLEYRLGMPKILQRLGFLVTSLSFDEEEDSMRKESFIAGINFENEDDLGDFAPKELECTLPTLVISARNSLDLIEQKNLVDSVEAKEFS